MAGRGRGSSALGIAGVIVAIGAIAFSVLAGTGAVSAPGACIVLSTAGGGTGCGAGFPPAPSLQTSVSGSTLTIQNGGPASAFGYTAASILYSWGDGTADAKVAATASTSHTYSAPGEYSVRAIEYWAYGTGGLATFLTTATTVVPIGSNTAMYDVTFTSGASLPSGTAWSVTFNGLTQTSATNQIAFTSGYGNGTYAYSVAPPRSWIAVPASGTVDINGASATVNIAFGAQASFFSVSFTENGLPSGSSWSVDLGGTILSSSASTIIFGGEASGTYTFTVLTLANLTASPSSGSVTVSGADAAQSITFASTLSGFPVTFVESGLPSGATWTVTLGGAMQSSRGPSIVFVEPAGTYAYAISSSSGPSPSPSSGSITVVGSSVTQQVAFGSSAPFWTWTPLSTLPLVAGIIILLGAGVSFIESRAGAEMMVVGVVLPALLYLGGWVR